MTNKFKTTSSRQTKKLAALLAQEILSASWRIKKQALVLALSGDLGAGKTTFTQGFLRGLGVRGKIASPSFTLIKNYELRIKNYGKYKKIFHIDCYRIYKPKDILSIGIKEILSNSLNIVLIEWPERIKRILPSKIISIKFKHGLKENERVILIND